MRKEQEKVARFHRKHSINVGKDLVRQRNEQIAFALKKHSDALHMMAESLLPVAREALTKFNDDRIMRTHLMVEELAETIHAMAKLDVIELADGLGDLLYVTLGTAVTYGIPMAPVFNEICRSNMTKRVSGDTRVRDKGPEYVPPDIAGALCL